MGTQERLRRLENGVKVVMDDKELEEDPNKSELLLGCQIQSNFKWGSKLKNSLNN